MALRRTYYVTNEIGFGDKFNGEFCIILEHERTPEDGDTTVIESSLSTRRVVFESRRLCLSFEYADDSCGWNYWLHRRFRDYNYEADYTPTTVLIDGIHDFPAVDDERELITSGTLFQKDCSHLMEFVPERTNSHHWFLCAVADGRPWNPGQCRSTPMPVITHDEPVNNVVLER
jgi:hypothetical protein